MKIRAATSQDVEAVRGVHLSAFPEAECMEVAKLAVDLLTEESTPPTISLVAEADTSVLGHVAFSPVSLESGERLHGYILAPLAVNPAYQKRGVGSKLVESGMEQLSEKGVDAVLVYGDPDYYGKFGFSVDVAQGYLPPYSLTYPFGWQAIVLRESGLKKAPDKIVCAPPLCDPGLW